MATEGVSDIVQRALVSLLTPADVPFYRNGYCAEAERRPMRSKGMVRGDRPFRAQKQVQPSQIAVLEWLSGSTVSVFWSDACTGHYAEQLWRLGLARRDGYCALSGHAVHEGEFVFRPRSSLTSAPANWDRMILASKVPAASDRLSAKHRSVVCGESRISETA
jgi:hypothetical protein